MRAWIFVIVRTAGLVLMFAAVAAAQPGVGSLNAQPEHLVAGQPTPVTLTVSIPDPTYVAGSANLQRRNASNAWAVVGTFRDDGSGGDQVANDRIFTVRLTFQQPTTGDITLRASAAFRGLRNRLFSDVRALPAGVELAGGVAATVQGSGGARLIIPAGSIPFPAVVGIEPQPIKNIVAPAGNLPIVAAVNVILQPTTFNGSTLAIGPIRLSIPAPASTAANEFLVAQQVIADMPGANPGLRERLVVIDTARRVGSRIVGDGGLFVPGSFEDGDVVVLENRGSGFATGVVSDSSGPRPGAVVSNDTNTLVAVTNAAGQYTLFISGGPFAVTAFDPFRGSSGTTTGNVVTHNATVAANITVTPLAAPPVTRDGIRNGGFERGDLSSWGTVGEATTRQQLTSTTTTILPTEGQFFADLATGIGAAGQVGSSLKQNFIVPAGGRTLSFDYNFVSEEFPEFVNSPFDDSFRALITTPNGQTTIVDVSVNSSGGFTLIGDCGFPDGDNTCGQTGWRTASVDLSTFATTGQKITVELLFSADDRGDDVYDTHVLVDNVRFRTLWVDAKIIAGAASAAARVQAEVRGANEILSQAGINVRLRNVQSVADPAAVLDTDLTWDVSVALPNCADGRVNGQLTPEAATVVGLQRSATPTDVNVYYVRSGTVVPGTTVPGYAVGPDEFCLDVALLVNSGVFLMDAGAANTMAHDIGHLLLAPETTGNTLEHSAPAGNFMTSSAPPLGVLNRQQSQNINRTADPSPLLVP